MNPNQNVNGSTRYPHNRTASAARLVLPQAVRNWVDQVEFRRGNTNNPNAGVIYYSNGGGRMDTGYFTFELPFDEGTLQMGFPPVGGSVSVDGFFRRRNPRTPAARPQQQRPQPPVAPLVVMRLHSSDSDDRPATGGLPGNMEEDDDVQLMNEESSESEDSDGEDEVLATPLPVQPTQPTRPGTPLPVARKAAETDDTRNRALLQKLQDATQVMKKVRQLHEMTASETSSGDEYQPSVEYKPSEQDYKRRKVQSKSGKPYAMSSAAASSAAYAMSRSPSPARKRAGKKSKAQPVKKATKKQETPEPSSDDEPCAMLSAAQQDQIKADMERLAERLRLAEQEAAVAAVALAAAEARSQAHQAEKIAAIEAAKKAERQRVEALEAAADLEGEEEEKVKQMRLRMQEAEFRASQAERKAKVLQSRLNDTEVIVQPRRRRMLSSDTEPEEEQEATVAVVESDYSEQEEEEPEEEKEDADESADVDMPDEEQEEEEEYDDEVDP